MNGEDEFKCEYGDCFMTWCAVALALSKAANSSVRTNN